MKKAHFIIGSSFILIIALFSVCYLTFFKKPYLTVVGVVNMADGLGRQGVELVDTLRKEVSIGFLHTAKPSYRDVPLPVKKIIKNQYRPLGKIVIFEECVWTPEKEHYKLLKSPACEDQIRFAYSMFESSEIPSEWVSVLNTFFDAVLVPDEYHVKVYQSCGVEVPIFVLPLGLNLQPFLGEEIKKKPHYPIVFGNMSACLKRKNQKLLVEAFYEAFGDTSKVHLRINSRYAQAEVANDIRSFIKEKNLHNIVFTEERLDKENYLKAFKEIDCLVSISTGEGFSIQPREAMALGMPVIVSDNSAQKTICRTGLVKSVKSVLQQPALRYWGTILKEPIQYGYEYNCAKEDVVEALLDVYENYDVYLAKAERAKQWAKKYDYSEIRPYYLSLIRPHQVILSTKNKIGDNCLYTNSNKLYKKYKKLLKINKE